MKAAISQQLQVWIATMVVVSGISFAPMQAQETGVPVITSFPIRDTGHDTRVWTTTQDESGVLYFGADGLLSFDGARWRTTPLDNAYALRSLDFGRDGKLWFAANRELGWFARTDDGGWKVHSLRAELPFPLNELGEMWHVFAEKDGALFVSRDKVLRWDGKKFQVWPMAAPARLVASRAGGIVYVHHIPTGLHAMGTEGPVLVVPAPVLGPSPVYWVEKREKDWHFVTSRGLFHFSADRLVPFAPEASRFISQSPLTSVASLANGELAIGTFGGGIGFVRPDGSLRRVLNAQDGLPNPSIYSLFVDREQKLWATSTSHLYQVPIDSGTAFFDRRAGLPSQPVGQVVGVNGNTFAATETGVYEMRAGSRGFKSVDGLRAPLRDLRVTDEGISITGQRSVYLLAENSVKRIHATDQDIYLAKPSRTTAGRLLVSEGRSIVAVDRDGTKRTLVRNLADFVTSIAEDSRGQLWLGTFSAGVLLAQPNETQAVDAAKPGAQWGAPELSGLGSVVATNDGAIVLLAPEGGWILSERAERFQPVENYPVGRTAFYSYLPSENSVWIIHPPTTDQPASAARVLVRGEPASWQPHSVEGLWEIGSPRSFYAEGSPESGTRLWIGGTKGLLRAEVPNGPSAPMPPTPLLFASSRGADGETSRAIAAALPYSTKSVRFEFAAPHSSLRPALRLQTFIEGVDPDWIPADATAARELTALRDGNYFFRVRTVAETGMTSEPAVFAFQVLPPWWRTFPAIAGAMLAIVPAIYGLFRLRLRSLRRRNTELEKKVEQRTAQLAQASAAKTEFVANMSHDIRNPLNGIVGLALALDDTPLDPKQREIVATLRECTTYLSSLVDDVLDFASIEAGRVELKPGAFAPKELLQSVATTLHGDATQRGAKLLVEADPQLPPTLLGDAGRIQQILVNYVSNALKYAGGSIHLRARQSPDAPEEIEFAVIDHGPGITEADTATLFTKFTRLANARGESIKGSGLGLAACRLLADIMGGSVAVESTRDVGSTFFLRLPLTVVTEPPVATPNFGLPSATVLVVEDADYNAWAAEAVLTKLGLPSERARTGAEALELFTRKRFDVVLLDRNLPDLDGTEVAKRIRVIEADRPRAILLAVTAYCTADDRAQCLAAGMDAFVGKPLTPDKLRKVLLAAGRRLLTAASVHVSPDAPTAPALDLSLLNYLSDGTEQGLGEQIDRFLATLAEAEDRLEHASSARDFVALAGCAHQVLSQAKMIGGAALEIAASTLEQAARAEDPAAFGARFGKVRHEMRVLKEALRRRRPATYAK